MERSALLNVQPISTTPDAVSGAISGSSAQRESPPPRPGPFSPENSAPSFYSDVRCGDRREIVDDVAQRAGALRVVETV